MKKSLLIAVAALFVAVGANAQYARIAQTSKMLPLSGNATKEMKFSVKQDVSIVNRNISLSHRAAGVDGTYIMESDDSDGFTFLSNRLFTIESSTGTITLDQYEGSPSFDYNVVVKDFAYSGGVAYGFYNEEGGFIEIPSQTVFTHATYGPFVLSGAYEPGDGYIHFGKEIILIPNEDGGFDIYPDVEEGGDETTATTGWAIFVPEYGDGGVLAAVGHDVSFFAPNAVMSSDVSGYMRTDGQTSGWQDERAEYPVFVEDFGSEYVVHNFAGMAAISVAINGDGTCQIPLPQYVDDYSYEDDGFVYGCMRLVGIDLDGESIVRNYDKTSLPGFVKNVEGGQLVDFFELTDEGKVLQDETHSPYLQIATGADANKAAYVLGSMFAIRLAIPTSDPSGISEVSTANKTATAKTYNMLGQQVNAGAKGLLIRDGRKFIAK